MASSSSESSESSHQDMGGAESERSDYSSDAGLLRDGLRGLSFESGVADSAPEGIAANESRASGNVQQAAVEKNSSVALLASSDDSSSPPELRRKSSTIEAEYPSATSRIMSRTLPHEYRPPPALQLPDQTMMDSELAAFHHHHHGLPATLAVSPSCHHLHHDGKAASLDPNAKEYTPSPCISPGVPPIQQHHIGVPSSYNAFDSQHGLFYSPTYAPESIFPWDTTEPRIPPFQSLGLPSVSPSQPALTHAQSSGREHVSRAILLNGVPPHMSDEQLKLEMSKWGAVRTVVSDQKHLGLVTVNFFDLRHAKDALRDIQQQHLNKQQRMQQQYQLSQKQPRGSTDMEMEHHHIGASSSSSISAAPGKGLINGVVMWAQYTLPVGPAAGPDGMNQGTLVVFNLDVDTTVDQIRNVFEAHGDVKELRETPAKKQHKFVEFYDVRDASKALKALDGTEINGKRVKIEFSRPGGQAHKARVQLQQQVAHGTTAFRPSQSVASGQPFYLNWNAGDAAPLAIPGPPPSYLYAASHIGTPVPLAVPAQTWNNAAPTYNYASSSSTPLVVMPNMEAALSFGRSRAVALPYSGGPVSPADTYTPGQSFGRASGTPVSGPVRGDNSVTSRRKRNSSVNGGYGKVESSQGSNLASGGKLREGPRVGTRISTNKMAAQRADVPPQYVFDESGVQANDAQRTTLMIKNIPNKYSQQMLLQLLDTHCNDWNQTIEGTSEPESAYDFVYLPIDFKNRCNLGYAFVNFTTVQATARLYRSFHQQQWEEFNSRKVCHVTYARVQGRVALEEHFRNSRFACDTDDYLPLIFRPPRNGTNTSAPATVAAVHQSSRVTPSAQDQDQQHHSRGPRNGERDELTRRVLANGITITAQELEMELAASRSGGSASSSRSNTMPQQQQQNQNQNQQQETR